MILLFVVLIYQPPLDYIILLTESQGSGNSGKILLDIINKYIIYSICYSNYQE